MNVRRLPRVSQRVSPRSLSRLPSLSHGLRGRVACQRLVAFAGRLADRQRVPCSVARIHSGYQMRASHPIVKVKRMLEKQKSRTQNCAHLLPEMPITMVKHLVPGFGPFMTACKHACMHACAHVDVRACVHIHE
jgi:hypothetical protein